jgi:hypothetical protein
VILATLLAETPALPLHTAGKYVAGAYIVLFALVLIYVAIMAIRLSRIERDLGELLSMSASSPASSPEGEGEHAPRTTTAGAEHDEHTQDSQDPQPESTLA